MDITQLSYFLQICEDGSFSKAANHLYISQQGLSMSISRLERELGQQVFTRTPRGLEITPSGAFLQARAEKILELYGECERYFDLGSKRSRVIPVACVYNVIGRLPAALQQLFYQNDSRFCVQVNEAVSGEVERLVEQRDAVFGFCLGPVQSPELERHFLFRRKYCFIVNTAHPLARYDRINISQLKGEQLLVMNQKFKIYSTLRQLCRKAGFEPNYVFESDRLEIFYNMVRNNPSLVAHSLDCYAQQNPAPNIHTLYLKDCDLFWDVYLIYRRGRSFHRSEEQFRQMVLDTFSAQEHRSGPSA